MNLANLDLNLLVIFDALYEQRQVTRAAQKVGLTQPAMSNALGRLRVLLKDPLFIRVGTGMQPTSRAQELSRPISSILSQLGQVFGPSEFIPARSALTIRVATMDYVEVSLLPRLLQHLRTSAPTLKLVSRRVSEVFELPRNGLESGDVDIAIGPFPQPAPLSSGISGRHLYFDPLVCIVRAAHPVVKHRLTRERYASLEHVAMLYLGREAGQIDRALAEHGMKRTVVLSLQPWISAAFAVANSDWIATVPYGLARYVAGPLKLAVVNFPFPVPPLSIGAFWHNRNTMQPSSMWVRDGLVNTVREMELGRQKVGEARK